jgi:aerobic carbon-monoxide dehydrogenase large subunit
VPRAHDVPPLEHFIVKHPDPGKVTPSPTNPLGVKGVGEGGTIGATPAIMCAVTDALVTELGEPVEAVPPFTAERVWRHLHR